jgi:DNA-binding XRE family transcriptional regulator
LFVPILGACYLVPINGAIQKSFRTPKYAALRSQPQGERQNAGLYQRDLATRLRVPHSGIAKVENEDRRPNLIEFSCLSRRVRRMPSRSASELAAKSENANPLGASAITRNELPGL